VVVLQITKRERESFFVFEKSSWEVGTWSKKVEMAGKY
jgi:hypothetical protein